MSSHLRICSLWRELLSIWFILCVLPSLATGNTTEPAQQVGNSLIGKLLTFAGPDSVRIEVFLRSDEQRSVALHAEIVEADTQDVLWSGPLGRFSLTDGSEHTVSHRVTGLSPKLWSPSEPHLYLLRLHVQEGQRQVATHAVRFGFKSFVARPDGRFYLNGKPIYLRGLAINPPGRTIPDHLENDRQFVLDYIRYLQDINVNIIRLTSYSEIWLDVCDEMGMMLFQGRYGVAPGASSTHPPENFDEALQRFQEDVFEPLTNHPSVAIYVLANEQSEVDVPWHRTNYEEFRAFYQKLHQAIRRWDDDLHPIIGNAGYGMGRAGDVCDIHRYWGWYYGSFGNYFTLLDADNFLRVDHPQPITMTECVGNYTGVEGRFNLCAQTKQPDSALHWTGFAPQHEQKWRALEYQAWMVKQATELNRRFRSVNPLLSGTMPFTILFHHWHDIEQFSDMDPKPAAAQLKRSYSPVLLSWEHWQPNVYAGAVIEPIAHVVNDHQEFADLKDVALHYELTSESGRIVAGAKIAIGDVPYYETKSKRLSIPVPDHAVTGEYRLHGRLLQDGAVLAENSYDLFIADRHYARSHGKPARAVMLYDSRGQTIDALDQLEIGYTRVSRLDALRPDSLLVVGELTWDQTLQAATDHLAGFVDAGGRILVLGQAADRFDASWLPVKISLCETSNVLVPGFMTERPFANGMAVNPQHPDCTVFDGITRGRLFLWSDYTDWDQQKGRDYPKVYPVMYGFALHRQDGFENVRVLANHEHGLVGIALAELFSGNGSVILSGFNCTDRSGLDPVADRMLGNLIAYGASNDTHHPYNLITEPVVWGDYESEDGLLTGIHSGLILNTTPLIPPELHDTYPFTIDLDDGAQFARTRGGWNSRPSIQYVPNGRRPYGPYYYSQGGNPRQDGENELGTGLFRCRVPADVRTMVTTVENPADRDASLTIAVNGHSATQSVVVPAGQTLAFRTPLPADTELAIGYTAHRYLVLLQTAFE